MKLSFENKFGGGRTVFEVRREDDEVWVTFPVRARYGSSAYRLRFAVDEALQIAEAIVDAAGEVHERCN